MNMAEQVSLEENMEYFGYMLQLDHTVDLSAF